ncbi:hypothetical protein ACHAO9_004769 [Fusarium lateritium]
MSENQSWDSAPGTDKRLYNLVVKTGTDANAAVDFAKSILKIDGLPPWVELDNGFVAATIEASPEQAAELATHLDIDRVVPAEVTAHGQGVPEGQNLSKKRYYIIPIEYRNRTQFEATSLSLKALLNDEITEFKSRWMVYLSDEDKSRAESVEGVRSVMPMKSCVKGAYAVEPIDRDDQDQCKETNSIIQSLLGHHVRTIWTKNGNIQKWTVRNVSFEQVSQIESINGVLATRPALKGRRCGITTRSSELSYPLREAEVKYETQKNAATELVAISQPSTIPELNDLKNYVYEGHQGGSSFVYHIETGVAFKAQSQEFPNVATEHLLTEEAIKQHDEPWVDDTNDPDDDDDNNDKDDPWYSHGTCTAGKALGTEFGASKKATLVVARLHVVDQLEVEEALKLILEDLNNHPERRKRSVVSMSLSMGIKWSDEDIKDFEGLARRLIEMDVPFVCIAGNIEDESPEPEIDEYPQLLQSADLPIVVVASVDSTGSLSEFSKTGPQVTIHAVGEEVNCLGKEDADVLVKDGTSYAAPLVAGEIANLLSYETVPFDTSDGNLVRNLIAYLQSDKGSWERFPGIRVLWNGVEESNNPKELIECNGLQKDVYVERDDVHKLIEDDFCPTQMRRNGLHQEAGTVSRIYNINTPNKVTLAYTLEEGTSINPQECVKYLMMALDGCVYEDNNISNYQGGGQVTVAGSTYSVSPGTLRSPAGFGKQGGCDSAYKVYFNRYWVWGHGWASSDNGETLKEELKGCALFPDTWHFTYGLGDDGREWTAEFRTGVFQKKCVGHTVITASGIDNLKCYGTGW